MSEEGTPETIEPATTGKLENEDNGGWERLRGWLRLTFAVILAVLLVTDVALYSLYQAEHSRVESMAHRLDRTEHMLLDFLASQDNSEKLEAIEQKMSGIESRLDELTAQLKQEAKDKKDATSKKD